MVARRTRVGMDTVQDAMAKASDTDVERWLRDLDDDGLTLFRRRLYNYCSLVNTEMRERNNYRALLNAQN